MTAKSLLFLIEKTHKQINEHTSRLFREQGAPITKDQWAVLKEVVDKPESTQKQIADFTLKDPAALTRILDLLEKNELIQRRQNLDDRRSYRLIPSVEGSRLVARLQPLVENLEKLIVSTLNDEELEDVLKQLGKLNQGLGTNLS